MIIPLDPGRFQSDEPEDKPWCVCVCYCNCPSGYMYYMRDMTSGILVSGDWMMPD
ncbi:MAG: hypothetical protein ACFFDN_51710 [Candidatus Hodarchaeota archaeon]